MLIVQKMERDEWHDLALLPFEENSGMAIARGRFIGQRLRSLEGGVMRLVARGDSPAGASPAFKDGDVLWAN